MLKSMTGYGTAASENENLQVTVEIKSLNSKYLDLNLKLSREYADRELEIRSILNQTIERGKVSLSIEYQQKTDHKPKVSINKDLLKAYYDDLKKAAEYVGATDVEVFKIALQMPKAINTDSENKDNTEEWNFIVGVLKDAIAKCDQFRLDEGKSLEKIFKGNIQKIEDLLIKVEAFDPKRIENLRERIKSHVEEYAGGVEKDNGRFEQELIYYIEKLDISEEKVRLKTHLKYFLETMKGKDANGKKLGFIAQEIGREINTIGSKSNDADIQKCVVEMKEELEKIKEQVMNVL